MIANACKGLLAVVAVLLTLTSGSAVAAVATTDGASSPTERIIQMEGRVNPGGAAVTSCFFEYGTDATYGAVAPCTPKAADLGSGTADVAVTGDTQALEPGVTYHYRLVASDAGGTSSGQDQTFALPGTPLCQGSNLERRLEQGIGTILLPNCMALEQVSPPRKFNQPAAQPSRISATGSRVVFNSQAGLEGAACLLGPLGTTYVASRGAAGWTTRDTCLPDGDIAMARVESFSSDLSGWFVSQAATTQQVATVTSQSFTDGLDRPYLPISPLVAPLSAVAREGEFIEGGKLQGASADHSHAYLLPDELDGFSDRRARYLLGDPEPTGAGADFNVYVAYRDETGQPALELLARDRDGKVWGGNCGARLGGGDAFVGGRNQGAVSADGSRVYFSTRPTQPGTGACDRVTHKLRIMQRTETPTGPAIAELFPSSAGAGDDLYQGASVDGTKVYFLTNRQLTATDLDSGAACSSALGSTTSCDLYLYDSTRPAGEELVHVSEGLTGAGANVLDGVTAISTDGSHIYFVAKGVLSGANAESKSPVAGQPNLYVWKASDESTSYVGRLATNDNVGARTLWSATAGTFKNGAYPVPAGTDSSGSEVVGGSGEVLLFESRAPLTADDLDGARFDVFRYDSTSESLERISKAMPGGSDNGAFDVVNGRAVASPPGTDLTEMQRWVSEDGKSVVFSSLEGLVPGGAAGISNIYLWREGELFRLPGLRRPGSGGQQILSHDGSAVAFSTTSALVPQDGDSITDVYVIRAGGGFSPPPQPTHCQVDAGGACQGPSATVGGGAPASATALSTGNVVRGCALFATRAKRLHQRLKRLRGNASAAAEDPGRSKALRKRINRLGRRGKALQRSAKRCRSARAGASR